MKSETGKRIINEITKETGLSRDVVYKIIMSQYGCLRDTMQKSVADQPETFQSVRYNYFGIFKARMKVFENMKGIQQYNKQRKLRKQKKYGTSNDQ